MDAQHAALLKLGRAERLQLVEDLWESITAEEPEPVSQEKRDELERRRDRHDEDPASGRTWEQVKQRARRGYE